MSTPPLLLGAVLAVWGWHSGFWWIGIPLALLAELPRGIGWRWELGLRERRRVADLCSLLLVLAGVYSYLNQPHLAAAILNLVKWSPVLLFPLLAVQLYGGRPGVELSALFLSLRRQQAAGDPLIDLRPAYVVVCLLASAMIQPDSDDYSYYYPSLALLVAWGLWPLRPQGRWPVLWGTLLVVAVSGGYALGLGLQQTQRSLEGAAADWLADWFRGNTDPYRTTTAIGEVGALKLSGRVILRVRTDTPLARPLLLRTASYNRYVDGSWFTRQTPFDDLELQPLGWHVAGAQAGDRLAEVLVELDDGGGMLPLPGSAAVLDGLPGARLSRNAYGAVKVLDGPALARYRVRYGGRSADAAPEPADLRIPRPESESLVRAATELGLEALPPEAVPSRIEDWFARDFRYALDLGPTPRGRTPLEQFLHHSRSGHCEFFASAAVLLLRQAGIPARYARGWSVQEYHPLEGSYVARVRHAHAWVRVWVDGAWRDFDPTPPDWFGWEARESRLWAELRDRVNWLLFNLRYGDWAARDHAPWLGAIALLLAGWLGWRIARRGSLQTVRRRRPQLQAAARTPFTPVEQLLSRSGHPRQPDETLQEWLARLEREGLAEVVGLTPALTLYYRQCFDPEGIELRDSQRLQALLQTWLRSQQRGECARQSRKPQPD